MKRSTMYLGKLTQNEKYQIVAQLYLRKTTVFKDKE